MERWTRRWLGVAAACALSLPAVGSADAIAPDQAVCMERERGDACDLGGRAGTCQPSTCYRNDYSQGFPPRPAPYDCLMCEASTAATSGPPASERPGDEGGAADEGGARRGGSGCATAPGSGRAPCLWGLLVLGGGVAVRARRAGSARR